MPDLLERLKAAVADRYAVESEIGRGGMATVFLAEDRKHRRHVAIKVLHPELSATLAAHRFLTEIQIAAKLNHPHILLLIDSGEADDLLYYVMPYVEGESLRQRLDRLGPLSVDEAVRIATEVADGLHYAHRQGVIHRDVKPGNILLSDKHAVITDFGIARAITAAQGERITSTGLGVGTPLYASPEQAIGAETLDGRTDIYSLGCVLYEMLSGAVPLEARTPQAVQARRMSETPAPLHPMRDTVPPLLDRILAKALARLPADRYATALELIEALEMVRAKTPVERPEALEQARVRSPRRALLAAAVIALAALATATLFLWRSSDGALDPDAIAVLPFRVASASPSVTAVAGQMPDLFWTKVTGDFGPRASDPATVLRRWRSAGGTEESPLPEEEARRVASGIGAGKLILGLVEGTVERLSLTASLLEVSTGSVRVPQTAVAGSLDSLPAMVDQLVTALLTRDFGEAVHRLPELKQFSPAAVQAYLAGQDAGRRGAFWNEAQPLFERAMQLDTGFVLAALGKWSAGETDTAAARYAWERQERLSRRDRAVLRAMAGWLFGETLSSRHAIAQWDSAVALWPDGSIPWTELGEELVYWGELAGVADWQPRAKQALTRALELDPGGAWPSYLLWELSLVEGDRSAAAEYARSYLESSGDPIRSLGVRQWLHSSGLAEDPAGDLQALLDSTVAIASFPLFIAAWLERRGLEDADRAAAGPASAGLKMAWARVRGSHPEWQERRESLYRRLSPAVASGLRIRDVLYLGEEPDSLTASAAALLEGITGIDRPSASWFELAIARCWTSMWRAHQGNTGGAREAIRRLREDVQHPTWFSACAALADLRIAEAEGVGIGAAARTLDSVARPVPAPASVHYPRDLTLCLDNLAAARALAREGDMRGALAAARRRPAFASLLRRCGGLQIDLLREEARLAAAVGDTTVAVAAYGQYLAVRESRPAHPAWAAQWDSVRAEYGAMTGVERP